MKEYVYRYATYKKVGYNIMRAEENYNKLSKKEKAKIEKAIEKFFKKQEDVDAYIIFGSFVNRNYFRDIDIAIISKKRISDLKVEKIGSELELKIKIPVDIHIFSRLPLKLKYQALKTGKPVLLKNREYVLQQKLRTITEFLDFYPFLKRYTKNKIWNC